MLAMGKHDDRTAAGPADPAPVDLEGPWVSTPHGCAAGVRDGLRLARRCPRGQGRPASPGLAPGAGQGARRGPALLCRVTAGCRPTTRCSRSAGARCRTGLPRRRAYPRADPRPRPSPSPRTRTAAVVRPSRSRCWATSTPATARSPESCSTSTTPSWATSRPVRPAELAWLRGWPRVTGPRRAARIGARPWRRPVCTASRPRPTASPTPSCTPPTAACSSPATTARPAVADDAEALLGAALASANLDVAAEALDLADARPAAEPGRPLRPRRARPRRGRPRLPARVPSTMPTSPPFCRRATARPTSSRRAPHGSGGGDPRRGAAARRPRHPAVVRPLPRRMPTRCPSSSSPTVRGSRPAQPPLAERVGCTSWCSCRCAPLPPRRDPARVHEVVAWAAAQAGLTCRPSPRAPHCCAGWRGWWRSRSRSAEQPGSRSPAEQQGCVSAARGGRRRSARTGDGEVVDVVLHHPPRPVLPLPRQQVRGPLHVPRREVEQWPSEVGLVVARRRHGEVVPLEVPQQRAEPPMPTGRPAASSSRWCSRRPSRRSARPEHQPLVDVPLRQVDRLAVDHEARPRPRSASPGRSPSR